MIPTSFIKWNELNYKWGIQGLEKKKKKNKKTKNKIERKSRKIKNETKRQREDRNTHTEVVNKLTETKGAKFLPLFDELNEQVDNSESIWVRALENHVVS